MNRRVQPVRVLIVPGLHGSGSDHWQTWLQQHYRRAVRVEQADWEQPDLAAWSARIDATLAGETPGPWVAVAHSFGCLALAHHVSRRAAPDAEAAEGIAAALFVAPAEPRRFGVEAELPAQRLGLPAMLVASDTDPWMAADRAQAWARTWGCGYLNLGDVGHINPPSGFGPWPRARHLTEFLIQRVEQRRRPVRDESSDASIAAQASSYQRLA